MSLLTGWSGNRSRICRGIGDGSTVHPSSHSHGFRVRVIGWVHYYITPCIINVIDNEDEVGEVAVTVAGVGSGAASAIVEDLELQILVGRKQPHERLIEDELMIQYDAKRHVVRQALQELEYRELVDRVAKVGSFVRAYDARQISDLYELRIIVETECARRIQFPVSASHIEHLRSIQARHDSAARADDLRATIQSNIAFHEYLFGLSSNTFLVDAVRRYARMTYSTRSITVAQPESNERSAEEHHAMIRALEQGNGEGLAALCRDHLAPARETYLRILNSR